MRTLSWWTIWAQTDHLFTTITFAQISLLTQIWTKITIIGVPGTMAIPKWIIRQVGLEVPLSLLWFNKDTCIRVKCHGTLLPWTLTIISRILHHLDRRFTHLEAPLITVVSNPPEERFHRDIHITITTIHLMIEITGEESLLAVVVVGLGSPLLKNTLNNQCWKTRGRIARVRK